MVAVVVLEVVAVAVILIQPKNLNSELLRTEHYAPEAYNQYPEP